MSTIGWRETLWKQWLRCSRWLIDLSLLLNTDGRLLCKEVNSSPPRETQRCTFSPHRTLHQNTVQWRRERLAPTDHRRADAAADVVVAGRDVGGERPERVERRFAAPLELFGHVFLDHVHGHVARSFV